jgi:hypothetical protein
MILLKSPFGVFERFVVSGDNKSLVGANRSVRSSQKEAVDDMQVFFHYRFLQITLLETVLL